MGPFKKNGINIEMPRKGESCLINLNLLLHRKMVHRIDIMQNRAHKNISKNPSVFSDSFLGVEE